MSQAELMTVQQLKLRKHYVRERLMELKAEREKLIEERVRLDEALAARRTKQPGEQEVAA